jgi:hypothetical protein
MANPRQVRRLLAGVKEWNAWRKRARAPIDLTEETFMRKTARGYTYLRLAGIDLSGANLSGAVFPNSDLSRANLSGANLAEADLGSACLAGANLSKAALYQASLVGTNLVKANLTGSYLTMADLSGADLSTAELSGAKLCLANLRGANLDAASLGSAVFGETILASTNLTNAKGLETCEHLMPSTLDIHTFLKSGMLPERFIRGCGLPDEYIRFLPSFLKQPTHFCSCFISYSHEDKAFARLLHDRLQGQGIRCWLDEHQLLPGDDLHEGIDRGIRLWDKVLLCASKSSLSSWWMDGEINRAFQKEAQIMKERGKKVLALIPLNLDGLLFSADYQSGKKAEITSRVAANFVGWEKDNALFDRELDKVIRALRTGEGGREKPPPAKL